MAAFYNQASLTYSGGTVYSNVAAGEITEVLSASKTAVNGEYTQGDVLTYVINIINSGASPVENVAVSDDLGAYEYGGQTLVPLTYIENSIKYFADGVLQAAPAVTSGNTLDITGITVPAEGEVTLVYSAEANEFAPLGEGGVITNTATVTGGVEPVTASATVNAGGGIIPEMQKSVSPASVKAKGNVTYTITIYNYGPAEAGAAENIVVNDTFDPLLTDISVTFDGTPWTSPANYAYNESTGVFSTVAGNVTVPAAVFAQDPVTGAWSATPGSAVLTVTGNL
ncbi:MAG: hypothetical protein J5530_05435 [Clostridia bacterium]|nr:hypothetical protein [Clostridia bacterium]